MKEEKITKVIIRADVVRDTVLPQKDYFIVPILYSRLAICQLWKTILPRLRRDSSKIINSIPIALLTIKGDREFVFNKLDNPLTDYGYEASRNETGVDKDEVISEVLKYFPEEFIIKVNKL